MNQIKQLIGKIKANPSEGWQGLEGVILAVCRIDDSNELVVLGPISIEERELFYRQSYESGLKDDISSDYEYCVFYLLNEDCELTCSINADQLKDLREVTKSEVEEYNKNLEEFKKIHKYYERIKQMEDEEKEEELAADEFNKAEKTKIIAKTKDGEREVDAVIYKGFGVHNILDYQESSTKSITILEGECQGWQLSKCSVSKYKQFIDEVRDAIGDRAMLITDTEKVKEIAFKY